MRPSSSRRRKPRFGPRRIRRLWPVGWYQRYQKRFWEDYKADYEALRADPYAWREYMDELAAWDPVCVPRDYFESPEKYAPLPDTPPDSTEHKMPVPPTWVPVEWEPTGDPEEPSDNSG